MELPLDLAVIGLIATGSFVAIVVAVAICCAYNKYCGADKCTMPCSICYQPAESDLQNVSVVANRTEAVKPDKASVSTLKESILTGEGPPTYQMAMEHSRVYAGQCYIGMSGESAVTPLSMTNAQENHLESRKPPEYQLLMFTY